MHSEYAIEPDTIGESWTTFKDMFDRFGTEKGRIISQMPINWIKLVVEALEVADIPEGDRLRMVERLTKEKQHKVVDFHRGYDPKLNWISNALREHEMEPFRAIICRSAANGCAEVLSPEDCSEDHSLIKSHVSQQVVRTSKKIAQVLLPIAKASNEIDLVDPYFDPRHGKGKYFGILKILFAGLENSAGPPKVVKVHYTPQRDHPHVDELVRDWARKGSEMIPNGYRLEFCSWTMAKAERGRKLHNRYILTEIGGISSGEGLSAEGQGKIALFSLMEIKDVIEFREWFFRGSEKYAKSGTNFVVDVNGAKKLDK